MKEITRRTFLKDGSLAAGAALALSPHSRVLGANDDVRVGVVGFRSQGGTHIRLLRELPGVRVVALCDPDRDVLDRGLRESKKRNEKVAGHTDVRKMLEDKTTDAITTATPDHWHALVTIWACQAGKDVYVSDQWSGPSVSSCGFFASAEYHIRVSGPRGGYRSPPFYVLHNQQITRNRSRGGWRDQHEREAFTGYRLDGRKNALSNTPRCFLRTNLEDPFSRSSIRSFNGYRLRG